jgi:geranyl-CoA carboxylase alpha subunit
MSFSKILIANRGEIACRVIRTARSLGYRTVAVYSDADAQAPHVAQADEAVRLGGSAPADSYLNVPALLAAARATGADAVHPGYGFLSENANFAQACLDAGLVFIGPPPSAITAMGDKALAKQRMLDAGVPCAPGYLGDDQNEVRLVAEGEQLGFPLLVKAKAGGGGRGMRLVHQADQLAQAIAEARREAQSAFGDGAVMLERLITDGRHIEIQVFADAHGNAVHLGERDCTAQRRRQKVIEEAPSPVVSPAMREAMGRDAVAAALAVGYRGAGTVEFIVDGELKHYFLEMNTRLQVEHPVTELITGLDLVEWQLRVAAGEPLPLKQEQIQLNGHAIEARLYAEDPYAGFVPQTGRIAFWRPQRITRHAGVRVDDGIAEGGSVSPYYDAMVAKVMAHGRDREDAIRRLRAALQDAPLLGLRNNGRFLAELLDHPRFRAAQMTTALLDEWQANGEPLLQAPQPDDAPWALAAALVATQGGSSWRANSVAAYDLTLQCEGGNRRQRVRVEQGGALHVSHGAATHTVRVLAWQDGELRYEQMGVQRQAVAVVTPDGTLHLCAAGHSHSFTEPSAAQQAGGAQDARQVRASVAGRVTQVLVQPGVSVQADEPLLCVEAMKMEMWLHAQSGGTVAAVLAQVGEQVEAGAVLVELELQPAAS